MLPLAVAAVYAHANSYVPGVVFVFAGLAMAGAAVGVAVNVVDWRGGGVLNASAAPASATKVSEATPLLL